MSKLDELLEKYTADLEAVGDKVDAKLLRAVAKGCGPAIYRKDASLVAASDKKELDRVKKEWSADFLSSGEADEATAGVSGKIDCSVCAMRPLEVLLEDCGHVCLCEECVQQIDARSELRQCPICRVRFTGWRRVYVHPFVQGGDEDAVQAGKEFKLPQAQGGEEESWLEE